MSLIIDEIKIDVLNVEKDSQEERLLELISSSFTDDEFYLREPETIEELIQLINTLDPLFIAKVTIFSRKYFHIKNIIYFIAAKLAPIISGRTWAKDYYFSVVLTLGDMIEIFDLLLKDKQKISNSIKKGFAKCFNKFDDKHISSYFDSKNILKIKHLIKTIHPRSLKRNEKSLKGVIEGEVILPELTSNDLEKDDYNTDGWHKLLENDRNLILKIIKKGSF